MTFLNICIAFLVFLYVAIQRQKSEFKNGNKHWKDIIDFREREKERKEWIEKIDPIEYFEENLKQLKIDAKNEEMKIECIFLRVVEIFSIIK